MSKTESFLRKLFLILLVAVLWNFIVPAIVASREEVFFTAGVRSKLPFLPDDSSKKAFAELKDYENKKKAYEDIINKLNAQLLSSGTAYADAENLAKAKEVYAKELAALKKPVKIVPFFESQTQFYFVFIMVFLCICIFLAYPRSEISEPQKINVPKLLLVAGVLYFSLQSTNWIRTLKLFDEVRTVFSYAHEDIGPISFYLQELRAFSICLLISLLWRQWIEFQDQTVNDVRAIYNRNFSVANFNDLTERVVKRFSLWQISMITILLAFFPWTFFYWNNFLSQGDYRFIIPAVSIHLCWLISWGLISSPFIYTFYKWSLFKSEFMSRLSDPVAPDGETGKTSGAETEKIIGFVKETNPLSSFQLLGAGIISVISFLLPLVNLLFK